MRTLLLLGLTLVAGCAHGPTNAQREQETYEALRSWKGKDINRAIETMGAPADVFRMPNGRTLYVWRTAGQTVYRNFGYRGMGGSQDVTDRCELTFAADPDGVIVKITWQGSCGVVRQGA